MSRIADVVAPPNEEGTKATILRWCKIAGESIRKDEPLLELETDKVTVPINCSRPSRKTLLTGLPCGSRATSVASAGSGQPVPIGERLPGLR